MKRLRILVLPVVAFVFPLLLLSACAITRASYTPEIVISAKPKASGKKVEYLAQKPAKAALRIGLITVDGNGFADFDDLVKKAKNQAAKLGGDFIVAERSGAETKTFYSPGYSTFQANSFGSYGHHSGYGNASANGYSVGPTISTATFPWSVFSVWIYAPSQLGLRLDQTTVADFHLKSDAQKSGVKKGDRLIGIDGRDISDSGLIKHLMTVQPGNKVKLTLVRGSKRIEREITAVAN